jgi:hypothetical protein
MCDLPCVSSEDFELPDFSWLGLSRSALSSSV